MEKDQLSSRLYKYNNVDASPTLVTLDSPVKDFQKATLSSSSTVNFRFGERQEL